ncbi:MAG: hypothetical protein KC425_02685, partial [Anaerolineales bacterium]|nr:hypothetical protein [Anaerolineales bacterium]
MSKRPREQRDVNPRPVILAGAGLLLGLVIVLAAMAGLLALFSPPGGLSAAPAAPQPAGEPQLQVIPPAERLSLEATQTARLHGY